MECIPHSIKPFWVTVFFLQFSPLSQRPDDVPSSKAFLHIFKRSAREAHIHEQDLWPRGMPFFFGRGMVFVDEMEIRKIFVFFFNFLYENHFKAASKNKKKENFTKFAAFFLSNLFEESKFDYFL